MSRLALFLLRLVSSAVAGTPSLSDGEIPAARERLVADGVVSESDLHVPEAVTLDELRLAHSPSYVEAVVRGRLLPHEQRRIGFPWSEMMVERSRRSAGATLAAARAALAATAARPCGFDAIDVFREPCRRARITRSRIAVKATA
jgi:acetoin utilization deacetylase AcuC-like enzyme